MVWATRLIRLLHPRWHSSLFIRLLQSLRESMSEVFQTTLNNVDDGDVIGIGNEGSERHKALERKYISCSPISTTWTTSNESATPNCQADLTSHMSVRARRLVNIDTTIIQITTKADSNAVHKVATVIPIHELMTAQLPNDRKKRHADEQLWEIDYARREAERRDKRVRYKT